MKLKVAVTEQEYNKSRQIFLADENFECVPYDLRNLKNVIMLPHTGSSTREACDKMAVQCLQNIYYAESGDYSKMDILNKDLLNKI